MEGERSSVKRNPPASGLAAVPALVILANHTDPQRENVGLPWAAGCQVIGIFGYRELEREHPRGLIGLTDISARNTVRASLGKNLKSFTAPWPLFLERDRHRSLLLLPPGRKALHDPGRAAQNA